MGLAVLSATGKSLAGPNKRVVQRSITQVSTRNRLALSSVRRPHAIDDQPAFVAKLPRQVGTLVTRAQ